MRSILKDWVIKPLEKLTFLVCFFSLIFLGGLHLVVCLVFRTWSLLCIHRSLLAGLGDHIGYLELNTCWLCARQSPYLLYYLCSLWLFLKGKTFIRKHTWTGDRIQQIGHLPCMYATQVWMLTFGAYIPPKYQVWSLSSVMCTPWTLLG